MQSYKLPSILYYQILPSFPWGIAVAVPLTATAGRHMGTVLSLPCRQLPCLHLAVALKQATLSSHRAMWNQSCTEIKNSNIFVQPNTQNWHSYRALVIVSGLVTFNFTNGFKQLSAGLASSQHHIRLTDQIKGLEVVQICMPISKSFWSVID